MYSVTGEATTTDAPRIIHRLCKHWSHKLEVQEGTPASVIRFPDAVVTLTALPDRLEARIESELSETPRRLIGVVGAHLVRMAGGDVPLEMRWPEQGGAAPA